MDVTAELEAPCTPEELFVWVEDLGRYPSWLDIVVRAEPVEPHDGDSGPAWSVDLRGRLGPFARSKRLRMVRTRHEPPHEVAFERAELDGRQHSQWTLLASVAPVDRVWAAEMADTTASGAQATEPSHTATDGEVAASGSESASVLTMRMHYGGTLVDAVVERLLADEIRRSKPRLLTALGTGAGR